ncbi:NAD-dependent epimerase/dehydratase family protein [archaeon]|nr:MAG: NAD-dependent epimerase/dehydratase family protein [archaeon]
MWFCRLLCVLALLIQIQVSVAEIEHGLTRQLIDKKKPAVLVTGAAGFIGSHLSKRLQEEGIADVVGLDVFNTYYNPALKWQRVENLLKPAGVTMIEGDVCDEQLIFSLIQKYEFKAIYHLAAQAGVRYSMQKPQAYVRENVQCFVSLIEQIRKRSESGQPAPRLLYASSSSVYGLSEKIPFSEIDSVDKLSNLYGATKRMNEITAYAYHNLFNLTSIGFRFFTVYGPWGRPDMAAYLFSDTILKGEPITVFNQGKLKRDFTYVDDIVAGLIACLEVPIPRPLVLNLGNNQPVEVMKFLSLLEGQLGAKAVIQYADSKAEIPTTFANITLANQLVGYQPKISIEQGLKKFVDWYKDYERKLTPCESECVVLPTMCYESGWRAAMEASVTATTGCNVVIYTVALDPQNKFIPWQYKTVTRPNVQTCTVAFVRAGEKSKLKLRQSSAWKVIEVAGLNSTRHEDILKLAPGKFFASSVSYAVYVHPILELRMHVGKILDLVKAGDGTNTGADKVSLLVVRNPQSQKDDLNISRAYPDLFRKQLSVYQKYRADSGYCFDQMFFDDQLLVHDMKSAVAKQLRCNWLREFQSWSDHGQIAGAFAVSQMAVKAASPAVCARYAAASASVMTKGAEDGSLIPLTKAGKGAMEYVKVLPNKLYHWHFTENFAKELQ